MLLSQIDDADLLAKALVIDNRALGEVHDRYFPQIYRYVYVRTGDEGMAEDIASETFLRLLDALHGGRPPHTTLRGWLFGVASHLVADHYSSKKMSALSESEVSSASTHGEAEERLRRQGLREAIKKLTVEQQEALALRFASGFSVEETARLMKRSVTAVKALQFRAVETLRHLLAETENE